MTQTDVLTEQEILRQLSARENEALAPQQSLFTFFWRRFRKHRMAMLGLIVLLVIILVTLAAPITARYDPNKQNLRARYAPPSWEHWMGTDQLGRDFWARVVYGGRISLAVGLLTMLVSTTIGVIVGLLAGFYGGWVDTILMRITDVFLALPTLFVLLLMTTILRAARSPLFQPGSFWPIAFIIGALSWMSVARLVRASTLEMRERDFVAASRALGGSDARLLFQHILPNVASPVIVAATLRFAGAIITESGLSFLGMGVQPPTPTWGNLLSNAQTDMINAPWIAIFPGLMIFITVIAVNYIGDGLRDALDPRHVMERS